MNALAPPLKDPLVPEHGRRGRIVVGIDGSESSIEALRYAVRAADAFGCSVEAVAAWTYPAGAEVALLAGWSPEHDAHEILETVADAVFAGDRPSWFSAITKPGLAARTLIEASAGAEMLVVGSRGHGGFVGLLLGSVSGACAEHAHCPVLIIRPTS
jgi:nucleotide-binding universal stress UspA family protein